MKRSTLRLRSGQAVGNSRLTVRAKSLRPGGQALIIDLRRYASKKSINEAAHGMSLSVLNQVVTFRFMLLKRAYTKGEFEQMISETKFRDIRIREESIGLEVWLSKDC